MTVINDAKNAPILGDANGDYCVDITDYNLVMATNPNLVAGVRRTTLLTHPLARPIIAPR